MTSRRWSSQLLLLFWRHTDFKPTELAWSWRASGNRSVKIFRWSWNQQHPEVWNQSRRAPPSIWCSKNKPEHLKSILKDFLVVLQLLFSWNPQRKHLSERNDLEAAASSDGSSVILFMKAGSRLNPTILWGRINQSFIISAKTYQHFNLRSCRSSRLRREIFPLMEMNLGRGENQKFGWRKLPQ